MEFEHVLLYSYYLDIYYDKWKNDDNIQNVLNMNRNSLCKKMKRIHFELCDRTIQCIVLAIYINMNQINCV